MTDVLGRPLTGEPISKTHRVPQRTGQEFLAMLDSVLAVDGVEAVSWYQYIPYFNDGDPCEFSVGEMAVKMAGQETSSDDVSYWCGEETGFVSLYDMVSYTRPGRLVRDEYKDVVPVFEDLSEHLSSFEDFLHDSFGDHSTVTATADGFHREHYDHD